jgi:hypothetical protein
MGALVGLHSLWRWVVLIVVTIALVRGLIGWLRGGDWTSSDRTLALLATTTIDIQVVLGLLVYGIRQHWQSGPFLAYVHPAVMIIALVVVHIFSARAKRATTPIAKHRTLAIGLLVTIFLITAAIPSYSWSRFWVS